MAKGFLYGSVVYRDLKRAASFAEVTVKLSSTGEKAVLFSESNQSVPIGNPLTTNENGLFGCFVEEDNLQLEANVGGYSGTEFEVVSGLSSGAVSGASFTLGTKGITYLLALDPGDTIDVDALLFSASGSDSGTDAPFVIALSEVHDPYNQYNPVSGEFTALASSSKTVAVSGTFELGNTTNAYSGTVYLQKFDTIWSNIQTVCSLSGSAGTTDSEIVDETYVETVNENQKLRLYFDITNNTGTDSATVTGASFSAKSRV